jgi:hypothetical protein
MVMGECLCDDNYVCNAHDEDCECHEVSREWCPIHGVYGRDEQC